MLLCMCPIVDYWYFMIQKVHEDSCVYDDILDDTSIDAYIFILELKF